MFSGLESWPLANESLTQSFDVKEESMDPNQEALDRVSSETYAEQVDVKPDTKKILTGDLDAQKSSAVDVEVALLKPMWSMAIQRENQEASEAQLQTLIKVKLAEVRDLIPIRTKVELKFKYDCQMLRQTLANLEQILAQLRAKQPNDPSVRIEDFQAQLVIKDWESIRMPTFERDYQDAAKVWYKPGEDPLIQDFSAIKNKFANLIAQFQYERSIRATIGIPVNQDVGLSQVKVSESRTIVHQLHPSDRTANPHLHLDSIEPFAGDFSDPGVLVKFAKWKRSWFALVRQLEQQSITNPNILFKRLKECVKGSALSLVSQYSPSMANAYKVALDHLTETYEDPTHLAGFCIRNGIKPKDSDVERIESVQQSLSSLHNMRSAFESEKVDLFDFSLIVAFVSAMPPRLQTKWNDYQSKQKRKYLLKREAALKQGQDMPVWNAGMAANAETFNAWLDFSSVKASKRQSGTVYSNEDSEFNGKKCVICGPNSSDHCLKKCPKALGMTRKTWRDTLSRLSLCFKCAEPFSAGHQCSMKCRFCRDRPNDMDHHILMCPMNKFRTVPLVDQNEGSSKYKSCFRKRSTKSSWEETKAAKMAKFKTS
ncbi:uncharacterized protein LOC131882375 [Tigriopus californicus]|uniref:uncharacterized protein LOC131882375 n=1 Tax=Tigriopus californicus TaxID=6832 RepID=UPI0027DA3A9B|nr:uncharacterized protein LOC131882375 [Tigriopus californicus]